MPTSVNLELALGEMPTVSKIIRCACRQSENPEIVMDFVQPGREMLSMYIEAVK